MTTRQHKMFHPGTLIRNTYIEPFEDMTANRIADELGCARSTFNRLVNENADISPQMAIRLSRVLGSSAESWMSLQTNYNLWLAEKKMKKLKIKLKPIDFSKVA